MTNRAEKSYGSFFIVLLIVLAAVLFYWAASLAPANTYEADIMEAASRMVETGHWGLPRNAGGELLYHTPILPYWLAAAGHLLLPNSPLGYRLFQILLALTAFGGYFSVIRKAINARTAFYSSCILASALFFSWQLQLATPDSLYALSICTAIFSFYRFLKSNEQSYLWFLYVALAIGILSKGLLALLLPLLIMAIHLMFRIKMNETTLAKIRFGRGMGLMLLLVLPWYLYAAFSTGGDWIVQFWDSYHIGTYFGGNHEAESPFYLPIAYVLVGLLPGAVFLFRALPYGWKYRVRQDVLLLSLLSILVILLVFAFSANFYPHYILPALPFGALLIGYRLSEAAGRSLPKMNVSLGIILLGILALAFPAYLYYSVSGNIESGFQYSLFMSMLLLPLAGTLSCFLLWFNRKTDEGIMILSLSYLLFNALLMYYVIKQVAASLWLMELLF